MVTIHQLSDYAVYTSTAASILYSVLPTVETFNNYPRFQKAYGLTLSILKQVAINLRNVFNPAIKTDAGTKISEAGKIGQVANPPEPAP
jgi:hypothetical protein